MDYVGYEDGALNAGDGGEFCWHHPKGDPCPYGRSHVMRQFIVRFPVALMLELVAEPVSSYLFPERNSTTSTYSSLG